MNGLAVIGAIASRPSGGAAYDENTATLRIDSFAADGTWTRPTLGTFWGTTSGTPSANRAKVELWAPGAGGSTNVGGGGGGAYARANDLDVSGASTFAVAGVTAVAANTNATDATFGTTLVVAKGGLSGTNGGTGGAASASTGDTKFDGGAGALGTANQVGGGGAGNAAAGAASAGGSPDGSAGASGVQGGTLAAGGGSQTATQLAGARGQCLVSYQVAATSGYARFRSYALTRSGTVTNIVATQPSGVTVGDLLVMIVGVDTDATITVSGWTSLGSDVNTTILRQQVFYRVATGSDAADITPSATTRVVAAIMRFAGAGTPTASFANGNSTNADPPSHATGGGSVNGIWIASAIVDGSAPVTITAPPSGYTSFVVQGRSGNTGICLTFALREVAASSENPGAFTNETEQWVSATTLVPPV